MRSFYRPIFRFRDYGDLGLLEPAAGFEVLEDGRVEGGVGGYGAVDTACVDEVEGVFGECPGECEVVDLEFQVWGDVGGLDWGEVCGYDGGGGELVGEVNCLIS